LKLFNRFPFKKTITKQNAQLIDSNIFNGRFLQNCDLYAGYDPDFNTKQGILSH